MQRAAATELEQRLAQAQARVAVLEPEEVRAKGLAAQLADQAAEVEGLTAERDGLRGRVEELERTTRDLHAAQEQLASLREDLAEREAEVERLAPVAELVEARTAETEAARGAQEQLQAELDRVRERALEVPGLQESLSASRTRIDELTSLEARLRDELDEHAANAEAQEVRLAEAEATRVREVTEVSDRLAALELELANARTSLEQRAGELAEAREHAEAITRDRDALSPAAARTEEAEEAHARAEALLGERAAQLAALEARLDTLEPLPAMQRAAAKPVPARPNGRLRPCCGSYSATSYRAAASRATCTRSRGALACIYCWRLDSKGIAACLIVCVHVIVL